jgi:hypothetical protein
LKRRYNSARTFDEFTKIFEHEIFEKHSIYLNSFFINYNDMKQIYSKVKGLLGYIYWGNVTMPINF